MKKYLLVVYLVVAILSVHCGRREPDKTQIEVIDGITHIQNPSTPRHPERSITLEEDLRIKGTEGEEGPGTLYQPVRLAVGESGAIYIIDSQDWSIKVFDPLGNFIREFGRKGQGPGEFQFITEMEFLEDGRLLVLDPALRRITLFSPEGEFLESHTCSERFTRLLYVTESSYLTDVFVRVQSEDISRSRALEIKEYDLKGNEMRSMQEFKPPEIKVIREGDRFMSTEIPHTPQSIFAGDSHRKWLYHCRNDRYSIEVFNREGTKIKQIGREYDPVPYSKNEADEFRRQILSNTNNPLAPRLAEETPLPQVKSVTQWMLVDDRGNLWFQTFEKGKEEGITLTAYDIFDKEGIYTSRIWLKYSEEMFSARFKDGRLYLLESDPESGFATFKRFKVNWSE